jgi:hypothetical protein
MKSVRQQSEPDFREFLTGFFEGNVIEFKGKFKKNGTATSDPFKHVRLSGEEMEKLHLLFFKLSSWVRYHGASLKSWFKDFDRHHNGLVTQDQVIECRNKMKPILISM